MSIQSCLAGWGGVRGVAGRVLLAAGMISMAGCPGAGLPSMEQPKDVQIRFRTFDIGTDDCEDIFSFGDFTVQVRVQVQPSGEEVFAMTRFAELGSAAFQATVQSVDLNESTTFALLPGEEIEIQVTVTEDDPINSSEPQPWSVTRTFDYLVVDDDSISLVNGPDCFRDDRLDFQISTR